MKIKNIILIILLIPIFIAIILFNIKFVAKFQYKNFMHTLENKAYERKNETNPNVMIDSFEELFCRYSDSSGLMHSIYITTSYFILILTIIELIILVIIQLKKTCCGCCKKCCSLFFPIHCLFNMIIYLSFAFNEKSEINLEKDKIYIFDEEFNKEIQNNLEFMKKRKVYLMVCTFVAILGVIGVFIIVILNLIDDCKNNKKKPQVVYVENSKEVNNEISIESENNIN